MPTLVSLKRHVNWHSFVGNNLEGKHECFVCKEVRLNKYVLYVYDIHLKLKIDFYMGMEH